MCAKQNVQQQGLKINHADQTFYPRLQTAARHIEASLGQNSKFHEKLRINTWGAYNDRVLGQI